MNSQQLLANREQTKAAVLANEQQLDTLINQRAQLQHNMMDAKNQYEGHSRSELANSKSNAEAAKQQIERLSNNLEGIDAQIKQLQHEINADKTTLATVQIEVSAAEIVEQQNAIKSDQERLNKIDALLAEQQYIIDQSIQKPNSSATLKKRRSILLAEAATGVDRAKKLATLDDEIAKAEQIDAAENQAKESAAVTAKETIEGLFEMKRSISTAIVNQQRTLNLMRDVLLGQMATAQLENYKLAAMDVAESLCTLSAIDKLIKQVGVRPCSGTTQVVTNRATLPALQDLPDNHKNGLFLQWHPSQIVDSCYVENVLNKLTTLGIELL